ncbi:MAG: histidine phosphatase family protein [Candidatus Thorarchaeota archaeon]
MKIYLVRHGETDYNRKHLLMGQMDIPMNELGINQVKKLTDALENKGITSIYSSDLSRAFKTAEIIGERLNLKPIPIKEFREHSMGEMDGTEWTQELEDMTKEEFEKLIVEVKAENLDSFYNRVWDKFLEIVENHNLDGKMLFVMHGGCTRTIFMKIVNATDDVFGTLRQNNCCINVVTYNKEKKLNKFIIEKLNDTNHLKEYQTDF